MAHCKGENHPRWRGGRTKHSKGYVRVLQHGHPRADPKGYVYEHVLVAEKALGYPLPPAAEIHHYGAKDDNTKIVICRNNKFHKVIHQRLRAMEACGHYNWRKCSYCKQYDKPENLVIKSGHGAYHKKCKNQYMRERYQKLKKEAK